MCNFLLDDLVISSGSKPDVVNVAQGPDLPLSPDCFTQVMIDGNSRIFSGSVLQADAIIASCRLRNSERTSCSMQRCHIIWELRDEPATATD